MKSFTKENPDKITYPNLPETPPLMPEPKPEKEKNEPFHPSPEIKPLMKPEITPNKEKE